MGKRHHFIPQMLLRNFASRTDAEAGKSWIYQIGRNQKITETTTRNVAFEKYFYGKEQVVESLLIDIEGEASSVIQELLAGASTDKHAEFLRKFVWLQSLRTRAIKQALSETFENVIHGFFESASETQLRQRLQKRIIDEFESIVAKELPMQLPSDRIVFEELSKTPGFNAIAKDAMIAKLVNENVASTILKLLSTIGYSGLVEETMQSGFLKGIDSLVRNPTAPAGFQPKIWKVQRFDERSLVLGDICVFAVSHEGTIGSLQKVGANSTEAAYIMLPIASDALLIGMNQDEQPAFDWQTINRASISLSWDYYYCHSSDQIFTESCDLINTVEPVIDQLDLQKSIAKAWVE